FMLALALVCLLIVFLEGKSTNEPSHPVAAVPESPPPSLATPPSPVIPKVTSPPPAVARAGPAAAESPAPDQESNPAMERLRQGMRRDTAMGTLVKDPDGRMRVRLNGGFQSVTAARRTADGRLVTTCFQDFDAL